LSSAATHTHPAAHLDVVDGKLQDGAALGGEGGGVVVELAQAGHRMVLLAAWA